MLASVAAQTPTSEAVARLLDHIFGAQRVVNVQLLAEGLCNFNYRVELDDGAEPCVLRIYGGARDACQKEAALLQLMRDVIPVPDILPAKCRGLCVTGSFYVLPIVA